MVHVYGVDVEVVDAGVVILRRRDVGLVQGHVVEAVPFEEHLAGLDVQLLDDALHATPSLEPPTEERSRGTGS